MRRLTWRSTSCRRWFDARVTRTAAMTVREFGRVSLMGGVGMLGGDDLALPYPWLMRTGITVRGQWMYPATANRSMANLIRSGLIDLDHGLSSGSRSTR